MSRPTYYKEKKLLDFKSTEHLRPTLKCRHCGCVRQIAVFYDRMTRMTHLPAWECPQCHNVKVNKLTHLVYDLAEAPNTMDNRREYYAWAEEVLKEEG